MKSIEYTKLKECTLTKAPDYLPEKIKAKINEIIEAINYTKTNPYISYFSLKNPYYIRRQEQLKYEKDSDNWYRYLKYLNRMQRCFCLVNNKKTAEIWNIFEKYAKSNIDYSVYYIWITNTFCHRVNYEQNKAFFYEKEAEINTFMREHSILTKKPEIFLTKALEVYNVFRSHMTLVAPDGADCFEHLDKNNPKDRIYLDKDGNPPYKMNWDILITDDEYFEFMDIFEKILEKLQNRVTLKNSRKELLVKILYDPASRKKAIDGAQEIYFAKQLYVKFMQEFNRPLYKAISLIIDALFGSPYTENDIIKFTKPIRENYKELEDIIREEGYEKLFDDSYIVSGIAENLKK